MTTYRTLLTNQGRAKLANAAALGIPLQIYARRKNKAVFNLM